MVKALSPQQDMFSRGCRQRGQRCHDRPGGYGRAAGQREPLSAGRHCLEALMAFTSRAVFIFINALALRQSETPDPQLGRVPSAPCAG